MPFANVYFSFFFFFFFIWNVLLFWLISSWICHYRFLFDMNLLSFFITLFKKPELIQHSNELDDHLKNLSTSSIEMSLTTQLNLSKNFSSKSLHCCPAVLLGFWCPINTLTGNNVHIQHIYSMMLWLRSQIFFMAKRVSLSTIVDKCTRSPEVKLCLGNVFGNEYLIKNGGTQYRKTLYFTWQIWLNNIQVTIACSGR